MTEKTAKRYLAKILESYTPGSVLHLLAEVFREYAVAAREADDVVAYRQCKLVEHALVVVGMGVDAAVPS